MIVCILQISLVLLYAIFILRCRYYWLKIKDETTKELKPGNIEVSVIIPVRNEAYKLPVLLKSLILQDYPEKYYQIIIVDDHSTDDTLSVADAFFRKNYFKNVKFLKCPGESKKEAITFGINDSLAELIITTDADTSMGKEWLSSIVKKYVDTGSSLICSPVKLTGGENYFEKLQQLEFIGLSCIGAAGIEANRPMYCNGANLAFTKKIFNKVNGYEDSRSFSGDDTQLMLKVHKQTQKGISFLKDHRSMVYTGIISQESELIQQRRRWASKIPATLSTFTILAAFLAWFVHVLLLIQFFIAIYQSTFFLLILLLAIKITSETLLLKSAGKFFSEKIPLSMIVFAQPVYCIYIVLIGLLAPFGTFKWKGRKVR